MPHDELIERIRALRYSWLTPWVKAALVANPDSRALRSPIQTFLDDELSLWIPEDSPWSLLASSTWWPLEPKAAVREIDAIFTRARERAAGIGFDFEPEAWPAAEEARAIFVERLFHPDEVRHFTNQPPAQAAGVPVPAIAATDGRRVGVLWLEQ
jgi:hypothetical protein